MSTDRVNDAKFSITTGNNWPKMHERESIVLTFAIQV